MDRCGGLRCEGRGTASTATSYGVVESSEACWSTVSGKRRGISFLSVHDFVTCVILCKIRLFFCFWLKTIFVIRSIANCGRDDPKVQTRVLSLQVFSRPSDLGSFARSHIPYLPSITLHLPLNHVLKQYQGHLSVRCPIFISVYYIYLPSPPSIRVHPQTDFDRQTPWNSGKEAILSSRLMTTCRMFSFVLRKSAQDPKKMASLSIEYSPWTRDSTRCLTTE
jgi:hypothetical protein